MYSVYEGGFFWTRFCREKCSVIICTICFNVRKFSIRHTDCNTGFCTIRRIQSECLFNSFNPCGDHAYCLLAAPTSGTLHVLHFAYVVSLNVCMFFFFYAHGDCLSVSQLNLLTEHNMRSM